MIPLTKKEKKTHNKQKVCYICKKGFSTDELDNDNGIEFNRVALNKEYLKVKDHRHYTGKYRGAAHNICNLRYKTPKEIPVVFHHCKSCLDYMSVNGIEFNGLALKDNQKNCI